MRFATFVTPLLIVGCTSPQPSRSTEAPYPVRIGWEDGNCRVEAGGRPAAFDKFAAAVAAEAGTARPIIVRYARETVPYRCIGGAIYQLQRAGFRNILFDPPFSDRPD